MANEKSNPTMDKSVDTFLQNAIKEGRKLTILTVINWTEDKFNDKVHNGNRQDYNAYVRK